MYIPVSYTHLAWMKDTATGEYVKGADVTSAVTGETNPGGELENIFYYLPADTFSTICLLYTSC